MQLNRGAPPGYTGAPMDDKTCANCHGGRTPGSISVTAESDEYETSVEITVRVTAPSARGRGFQLAVVCDKDDQHAGELHIVNTTTRFASAGNQVARNYVYLRRQHR